MRPVEQIESELLETKEKIAALEESIAANERELSELKSNNAKLLGTHAKRQRLPASIPTQISRIKDLTIEVDQRKEAILILQVEVSSLERESRAAEAAKALTAYRGDSQEWLSSKNALLAEVDQFLDHAKRLMSAAEHHAGRPHPAVMLSEVLDLVGTELSLSALAKEEIKLAPDENSAFVDQELDRLFNLLNFRPVNLEPISNTIRNVSDDPRAKAFWRNQLNSKLRVELKSGGMGGFASKKIKSGPKFLGPEKEPSRREPPGSWPAQREA
jgi:hypothetical protein